MHACARKPSHKGACDVIDAGVGVSERAKGEACLREARKPRRGSLCLYQQKNVTYRGKASGGSRCRSTWDPHRCSSYISCSCCCLRCTTPVGRREKGWAEEHVCAVCEGREARGEREREEPIPPPPPPPPPPHPCPHFKNTRYQPHKNEMARRPWAAVDTWTRNPNAPLL